MIEIKRWYFKNGYEEYKVLFENEIYILVQNIKTKKLSFGVSSDFGSFYGFPVNQSCLTKEECEKKINRFIEIDNKYKNENNIEIWKKMIERIKEV